MLLQSWNWISGVLPPLHPGFRVFQNVHTAGDGIACLTGHRVNHIVRILESDQHLPQNVDMLVE